MSRIFARQNFNPSCPSGGSWYACASGSNFVGCCNSEPCSNGCPDGNLEPASFDPTYFGQFPDQQCSSGSRWYTCAATSPPFMGCCKSNACKSGCPVGDVTAGFLSSNPKLAAPFLPSSASPSATDSASGSSTSSSSHISSTSSASSPAAASASPTNSAQPVVTSHNTSTGAIAGGAVGGVAVLALLVGLILFYCRRRTKKSREPTSEQNLGSDKPPLPNGAQGVEAVSHKSKQDSYQDSPYQTPTPAYTPYNPSAPSSPANPPGYPSISELDDTPITPFPQKSPQPSYELPSPDPSAGQARSELSAAHSTKVTRKDKGLSSQGHGAAYQKVPPGPASGGW